MRGRQYPESEDFYDGNWLVAKAHAGAAGASVWVEGPILLVQDVAKFVAECEAIYRGEAPSATLEPAEPELKVVLEVSDGPGHFRVRVEITPDPLRQAHCFEFEIDQSDLPGIVAQGLTILREYPVRGAKGR
ncbi:MAG: hypothetical protein U0S12_10195 [Fimbriimonadales bacterium]